MAVVIADGGGAISDLAVLRHQVDLFGTVASDLNAWRLLSDTDADVLAQAARRDFDRLGVDGLIEVDREDLVQARLRRHYRLAAGGTQRLAEEATRLQRHANAASIRLRRSGLTTEEGAGRPAEAWSAATADCSPPIRGIAFGGTRRRCSRC
ncbi:hypothetical protein [Micromonospora sp. MP36]|uniref:hypothetical protein n=1 Tax=unclassified Micromonospora TaxID=2617518 RepID=UPI0011D43E6D|nr:hypothetical protein FXF52_27165 [Micromonospora sp. MP36]